MIVVDTTVLVYAVGGEHPLREPCRRVVELISTGSVAATTTAEVIQEFAHVRARHRPRADAAELATAFVALLSPLLPVDEGTVAHGLTLFSTVESLGAFDAVLAAAALTGEAEALVSADEAFAAVGDLAYVDPFTFVSSIT